MNKPIERPAGRGTADAQPRKPDAQGNARPVNATERKPVVPGDVPLEPIEGAGQEPRQPARDDGRALSREPKKS